MGTFNAPWDFESFEQRLTVSEFNAGICSKTLEEEIGM